jgi:outer membrane protein
MIFRITVLLFAAALCFSVQAWNDPPALRSYIAEGMKDNLNLQKEKDKLRADEAKITEVKGAYLPTLSVSYRLTRAYGGRTISFPAGDLLNPVYGNLNVLNQGMLPAGAVKQYPQMSNVQLHLQPERDQEAGLALVQPVFMPQIAYSVRAARFGSEAQKNIVNSTKRELIFKIRSAYFTYSKALSALSIYMAALNKARENFRVTRSLVSAGKLPEYTISAAEADTLTAVQQIMESRLQLDNARSMFNLLIGKAIDSEITPFDPDSLKTILNAVPDSFEVNDSSLLVEKREEVGSLICAVKAQNELAIAEKSTFLPTVAAKAEGGYVGDQSKLLDNNKYGIVSIVCNWDLFTGFKRSAALSGKMSERSALEKQLQETRLQIAFQIRNAAQSYNTSRKNLAAAKERLAAAEKNFQAVSSAYKLGGATQNDLISAQTLLTQAQINLNLVSYDILIRASEYFYATAWDKLDE